ncbi:hypothetical protein TYRP_022309 [Tyrophagus putrescentiae]|nr:hypothetical protein TYRP_022309 [Tyrophagus putrescentiae]
MAGQVEEPEKTIQLAALRQMTAMDLLNAYEATPDGSLHVPEATRQTVHFLTIAVGDFEGIDEDIFSGIDWSVNCSAIGYFSPSLSLLKAEDGSSPLFPAIRHCTKWNTLHFEDGEWTQPTVQAIISAFPAVTKLVFFSSSTDKGVMERLTELLASTETGWGRQLTSLTLKISINTRYRGAGALFAAINALSALTYLKIDLGEEGLKLHELTVLDQLQEFSLRCLPVQLPFFISQLYATRNDRLRVEINNEEESIKPLAALRQHIRERIIQLSTVALNSRHCNLSDVCSKFPSLTSLALELPLADAVNVFSKIANLRHLLHLELSIQFGGSTTDNVHLFQPLLFVKSLELSFRCDSHDQLELLDLPRTMPHLQAIDLSYFTCRGCNVTNCQFRAEDLTPEKLASARRCVSAMLRILRPTGVPVGTISFLGEEHLGSAEQLLLSDV